MAMIERVAARAVIGSKAGIRSRSDEDGISARTVFLTLIFVDSAVLVVAGGHSLLGAPFGRIEQLFSMDNEPTIPGWLASVKLLLVACLVAALSRTTGTRRAQRRALLGAALVFVMMSCDEAAAVHERLQRTVDSRILAGMTDHIYESEILAKVVVGLGALLVVGITVIVVIQKLRDIGTGQLRFGVGFALLATGAVGVDLTHEFLPIGPRGTAVAVYLEEACEMIGVSLMVYAALQALARAPVMLHLGRRLRASGGTSGSRPR